MSDLLAEPGEVPPQWRCPKVEVPLYIPHYIKYFLNTLFCKVTFLQYCRLFVVVVCYCFFYLQIYCVYENKCI